MEKNRKDAELDKNIRNGITAKARRDTFAHSGGIDGYLGRTLDRVLNVASTNTISRYGQTHHERQDGGESPPHPEDREGPRRRARENRPIDLGAERFTNFGRHGELHASGGLHLRAILPR